MDPETQTRKLLIALAESELGSVVARQADAVLMDGADPEEQNDAALKQVRDLFLGVARNLGDDHPVSESIKGMVDEMSTERAAAPSV